MVEGARLESVYRGNSIEGSNPSLSATCKWTHRRQRPSKIGIAGSLAAVANAVYCSTRKRLWDLPITLDKLL